MTFKKDGAGEFSDDQWELDVHGSRPRGPRFPAKQEAFHAQLLSTRGEKARYHQRRLDGSMGSRAIRAIKMAAAPQPNHVKVWKFLFRDSRGENVY